MLSIIIIPRRLLGLRLLYKGCLLLSTFLVISAMGERKKRAKGFPCSHTHTHTHTLSLSLSLFHKR
jgi:hypothetical protein